jgi:hypothetical protein
VSSAQAERLEALLRSNSAADRAEIRSALTRLASEIRDRAQRGAAGSFDFFSNALRVLSRIRGAVDADLRLECLAACVSYFYQLGNQTQALESANQAVSVAALYGDPHWLRRSHSFAAAMHAPI